MKKLTLWIIIFLGLLLTACVGSHEKVMQNEATEPPYQVGVRELVWEDDRQRTIKTAFWYPTQVPSQPIHYLAFPGLATRDAPLAEGQFPLLIVSHGTGGHRYNQYYLSEFLASHGYVVIALEHPFNNAFDDRDAHKIANLWHRPQDVSFVLDQVLQDSALQPHLDETNIGMIGHSLGGYTALVIAGATPNLTYIDEICHGSQPEEALCDQIAQDLSKWRSEQSAT